jgi:hypothetical protein
MTGNLTVPAGTLTGHAVNKGQLDGKADSGHNHDATYVNAGGDSMTGALTLPGNPTANLHAATKQYVDSGDATQLSRSDIRTGLATVPIASNQNNGFVDVTWPALPGGPRVIATVNSTSVWMASTSAITATGCRITVRHVDASFSGTANIPVHFIAIYGLG